MSDNDNSILAQWNDDEPVIDVSLPDNQALQKFLIRRIAYERELKILLSNEEEVVGFVTAFDRDGWFQLSTPERQTTDYLLSRSTILLIEESGKSLKDYDDIVQARIRDYSTALKKQCERALNRRPRSTYHREDRSVVAS